MQKQDAYYKEVYRYYNIGTLILYIPFFVAAVTIIINVNELRDLLRHPTIENEYYVGLPFGLYLYIGKSTKTTIRIIHFITIYTIVGVLGSGIYGVLVGFKDSEKMTLIHLITNALAFTPLFFVSIYLFIRANIEEYTVKRYDI